MASSGAFPETGGAIAGITAMAPVWDRVPGDFERALEGLPSRDLDESC